MATIRTTRWWLHGRDEVCVFCLQRYGRGSEIRCIACDRSVCPCCARQRAATSEIVCPDCAEADDED